MPGCANYDDYYGGCLFAETCKVQDGKRCEYFERAVLPTATDIGLQELVNRLYAKQTGRKESDKKKIRKCPDCKTEIKPRQRYCDMCSQKRRLNTFRKSRKKKTG
jgi:hypothetical protein